MKAQDLPSAQLTECSINGIHINDKVTWTSSDAESGKSRNRYGVLIAFSQSGTVWVKEIVYKTKQQKLTAVAEVRQLTIDDIRKNEEITGNSGNTTGTT